MDVKPGYKMTEVGVIPEDWEVTQIEALKPFVTSGSRGWAAYYSDNGSPFIRITNLSRGCIYLDLEDMRFVNLASNDSEAARTQLHEGDVLISITADIGIIGYVSEKVPTPSYINQHIALVRFDPKQTNPRFVSYFLASENPQKLFRALTDSGAKAGMNLKTVQQLRLAFPPTEAEQTAIAEALSDADSLIASLQKLIAKKKAIKQGAMQELLTGKKRLPGFSGEWKDINLGMCFEKIIGGGTPARAVPEYWNGKVAWITVKDFSTFNKYATQETITKLGLNNSATHLIPRGTLITSTRMGLGKILVYDIDVAINQDLKALFVAKDYSKWFIYHWFAMNQKTFEALGTGSTVKGIRIEQLTSLCLQTPEKEEQYAIAQTLSDMDAEIEQLEKKLSKYQQIKQGMMQELLTGRIRLVDGANSEQKQPSAKILSFTAAPEQGQPAPAKKHNQHFDDAVMIAGIVDAFYSDKYPLGRKKVQKLLYLMRRWEESDVSAFQKKAAGPYADSIRYKGGEPIAIKSKYVFAKKGEKGTKFSRGENIAQALGYIQTWEKQESLDWLVANFQRTKVDDLELFATIDMAACDLRDMNKPVSVNTIKELISSTKEWRAKLAKTYFSDQDIQRAINKCREFFGEH